MTASASFLGTSLGPLTGGLIGANLGIRWVFALTAALLVANLVWVWAVVRERREG
jgi:DHA1 family multidrug resistance protein-like MFS transporter